ncbi:MAG: amidohydrolase family protein [Betaproteobacteria bacterium]
MIIDDHVHVHEWSFQKGDREFEADYVVELMDRCGIDRAVIMDSLAYIGLEQKSSNQHTRDAVDAFPDRLIGFANIKPPQGVAACRDEIKRTVEDWGFRGIKLHPQVDRYPANDRALVYPIVELAIEHAVPIWVHTGNQPNATPTQLGTLARDFPEANIIIGHMGSGMFYDAILMARRHPNLYVDMSLTGGHAFKTACEDVGAAKILFGSDAPYANPGAVKRMVEDAPLSAEDKALILGGNIARLIKLAA